MHIPHSYARFVKRNYIPMLIVLIGISIILGFQIQNIQLQPLDYKRFLPESSDTMQGLDFVEENFMNTDTVHILMTFQGTEGTYDWKDQIHIDYVERLSQKLSTLPFAGEVMSYTDIIKRKNNGSVRISKAKLDELMSSDEVLYPRDPVKMARSYVTDFEKLNSGIQEQEEAIGKLATEGSRIQQKITTLRNGIQDMERKTNQIYEADVTSGPDEIQEGLTQIENSLTEVSQGIRLLDSMTRWRLCSQHVMDPIFQDNTGILNPLHNNTYCYAYTQERMNDTYSFYCDPTTPSTFNETRCYAWQQYDYAISSGFTNIALKIENELIPGIQDAREGVGKTKEKLQELKDHIIEINKGLSQVDKSLERFQIGLEEYNQRMGELQQKTSHLADNVSAYNQNINRMYQQARQTLPGREQYEAQHFRISQEDEFGKYFSADRRSSRIIINLKKGVEDSHVRQRISDTLEAQQPPTSMEVTAVGDVIRFHELQKMIPQEMSRTSLFAAVFIIIILLLLLHRPLMSIFTLSTILFGTLWTFGLLGIIGMDLNPASAGVISLLLGIGIDFGIQMISEFIKHFIHEKQSVQRAIERTMDITNRPIVITASAALIGFFAMLLGDVSIMHDMGRILMIGTVMYLIAAFTVLPSILVMYAQLKKRGVKQ